MSQSYPFGAISKRAGQGREMGEGLSLGSPLQLLQLFPCIQGLLRFLPAYQGGIRMMLIRGQYQKNTQGKKDCAEGMARKTE